MRGKIGWSVFWVVIVGAISWCVYMVTPYIFGDKPIQSEERASAETMTEQTAPPQEYEQASQFISIYHESLNDLTGWGRIEDPSWDDVHSIAQQMMKDIDEMKYKGNSDLEKDFGAIRNLAKDLQSKNDKTELRNLHRYLHDLDVVMNHANGSGNYFGVTKWGKANG